MLNTWTYLLTYFIPKKLKEARYLFPLHFHQQSLRKWFGLTNHMLSLELWIKSKWRTKAGHLQLPRAVVPVARLRAQSWEEGTSSRGGPACISGPGSLTLPGKFWEPLDVLLAHSFSASIIQSGFLLLRKQSSLTEALTEIWTSRSWSEKKHRSIHLGAGGSLCNIWPASLHQISLRALCLPKYPQGRMM